MYAQRALGAAVFAILTFSTVILPQKSDQGSGNDDHSCKKAAKILTRGRPEKKEEWAYTTISGCAEGAMYLAIAWRNPPTDSVALFHLHSGSMEVRDHRIVDAVTGIVTDASLPRAVRVGVLDVLLAQYDRVSRLMSKWDPENGAVGKASDVYMIDGEQPVGVADRELISSTVLRLSDTDADPWMKSLATIVAADMGWRPWRPLTPLKRPPELGNSLPTCTRCKRDASAPQWAIPLPATAPCADRRV